MLPMTMEISLKTNLLFLVHLSPREIKEGFLFLMDKFACSSKGMEVILAEDALLAELNEKFLQCVGPTNVLSFPAEREDYLGELVISIPAVVRESFLYAQEPEEHFWRLAIHGFLHLLGFEHGEEMYLLTEELVQEINA
ncbi:MAG: putative rRNA maturation factor [Desulfonauticus sp.]|nr:putative rRNA maturation factor [Desulfonauticus sp.]